MSTPDSDGLLNHYGLITEEALASLLGISIKALKNRGRTNLPNFVKVGRRRLYEEASVREFLGIVAPSIPKQRSNGSVSSCHARGMSRDEAAKYIGANVVLLDQLVEQGRMPRPLRLGGQLIWDRAKLDAAFTLLS